MKQSPTDVALTSQRPRMVVLGSCVTRDSFQLRGLQAHLDYYHARSNLASMTYRRPLPDPVEIVARTDFEARCAREDMGKTIRFDHVDRTVIFDFIDDRLPIMQMDGSCFTYNRRVVEASGPAFFARGKIIRHYRPEHRAHTRALVSRFQEKNRPLFERNRIVIHHAKFNPYFDGDRRARELIEPFNEHLDLLHEEMLRHWKIDRVIDLTSLLDGPEATPRNHRWGHKPFHYSDIYAERLADVLAEEARLTGL